LVVLKGKTYAPLDMSITPSNVGCNTYNTALAIGEKAAVIIAEDLGIEGVTEE
jgi:alcohol oxidase